MAIGEWWTTPAEANYRLQRLGELVTEVTNRALGRGVKPNVPDALAREVGAFQSEYMEWRQSLGGYELVTAWKDELEVWERRIEALRLKVAAAGVIVPPPTSPLPPRAADGSVNLPEQIVWAGAGGLVTLAGMVVLLGLMRRGRR